MTFRDNACGPQAKHNGGFVGFCSYLFVSALAWLVPDLSPEACRWHDWHYKLVGVLHKWRGGNAKAADFLMTYISYLRTLGWNGSEAEMRLRISITRNEGDGWLRYNYRIERGGGVRVWFGSWIYWVGVRVGGMGSAS